MLAMTPRRVLGAYLAAVALAIHFNSVALGFLLAAAVLMLPSAVPPGGGYPARVRAAVEVAWRRLRGRRQATTLSASQRGWRAAMFGSVGGIAVGVGLALGVGWGVAAAAVVVGALSLRADLAE